jgi:DNA-directed RNA polymerase subunit RPC12/RpoP
VKERSRSHNLLFGLLSRLTGLLTLNIIKAEEVMDMAKCVFCGADTQLFNAGKPVCVDCDEKILKKPEPGLTRASRGAVELIDDVKPDKAFGARWV